VAESSDEENYIKFAETLDKAADAVGVNFIGGFSALVQKGYTIGDRRLIASIPEAFEQYEKGLFHLVNVASTKAGINMDAVREMGHVIKKLRNLALTVEVWHVPSLLFLPMFPKTIRLWRELFTE